MFTCNVYFKISHKDKYCSNSYTDVVLNGLCVKTLDDCYRVCFNFLGYLDPRADIEEITKIEVTKYDKLLIL